MNISIKRVIRKWSGALLAVVAGSMLLAACSESDDTGSEFDDWQSKNTTYWDALYAKAQDSVKAGNANWKIIKNWSLEDQPHLYRHRADTLYRSADPLCQLSRRLSVLLFFGSCRFHG